MSKTRFASIAFGIVLAIFIRAANADSDGDDRHEKSEPYAIGLWGDLPYSDVQALVGVPNLIADMNRQELAFTVHDGDLKAGNGTPGSVTPTTCSDALYVQALGFFNALRAPAILTPGDNDWTDCDRPSNGGFSSRERLDHERLVFFNTPYSLGQRRMRQEVQTSPQVSKYSCQRTTFSRTLPLPKASSLPAVLAGTEPPNP